MIRNVVVGRVRAGTSDEDIEKALQAIRDLRVDGVTLRATAGIDAGLRSGNASYALVIDLPDEDSYRRYDADAEHNRIRAELFAPISEHIERVQYRLPD